MSSFKKMDTEENRRFWEFLERNKKVVDSWPEWMRRGSVGELLVRELDAEDERDSPSVQHEAHQE
jgi:hypothetical protein